MQQKSQDPSREDRSSLPRTSRSCLLITAKSILPQKLFECWRLDGESLVRGYQGIIDYVDKVCFVLILHLIKNALVLIIITRIKKTKIRAPKVNLFQICHSDFQIQIKQYLIIYYVT